MAVMQNQVTAEHVENASPAESQLDISRLNYLRAAALLMVVIYHLFTPLLPGGFLGVDIFFVISGYLITVSLMKEVYAGGRVKFAGFIKRRFTRLFPSALFMLLLILPASLLISPDFRVDIRRQTAAVLSWVTNYYEIRSGASYENNLLPHLFVHSWTLGLEMQFYIIWGAFITMLAAVFKNKPNNLRMFAAGVTFVLILALWYNLNRIAFVSLDPSPAYYSITSRGLPLFAGAFTGLLCGLEVPAFLSSLARSRFFIPFTYVFIGLSAFCTFVFARTHTYSELGTYFLGIPVVSALTAAVLVVLRVLHSLRDSREPKTLEWLGAHSYSIYLFHWPLFIITAQFAGDTGNSLLGNPVLARVMALSASVYLAAFTYRYVEKRFRFGKRDLNGTERKRFGTASAAVYAAAFILLAAVSAAALHNPPLKASSVRDYEHEAASLDISMIAGMDMDLITLTGSALAETATPLNGIATISRGSEYLPLPPSIARFAGLVSVIGDSVTLGSSNAIKSAIPNAAVDAVVSRNMNMGVKIIKEKQENGQLGEFVVVALASNSGNPRVSVAEEIALLLEPGHRLIFVTGHGKDFMTDMNEFIRTLPETYPFVTIADWDAAISDKTHLLAADGVHSDNAEAKQLYADCIVQAIEKAKEGPSS